MVRIAAFAVVVALVVPAFAEDKAKVPDEAAMMAAMMKHGTPGAEHKVLEQLVGKWTYTGEAWMDPSKPPMPMSGTAERKLILGGRFLQDTVKSSDPNMPFEGTGLMGFDNHKRKYVGIWYDSMSTGIATSEGGYDAKAKKFTAAGEVFCPLAGKVCQNRDETTVLSADEVVSTFYKTVDGKESKAMALKFKRAK